jgi:hypothetical protein
MRGGNGTDCPCTAHISNSNSDSPESEFAQVTNTLELAYLVATPNYYYPSLSPCPSEEKEDATVMVIPEQFRQIFYGSGELQLAGMVLQNQANNPEKEQGHYVYDRTGTTIQPITTKTYYVKELKQDLLGGRALTSKLYQCHCWNTTDL